MGTYSSDLGHGWAMDAMTVGVGIGDSGGMTGVGSVADCTSYRTLR
jgi:hypothetical protein